MEAVTSVMSSMKMTSELKVKGSLSVGKGGKREAEKDLGESRRRAWRHEGGQDSGWRKMKEGRTVKKEGTYEQRQEGGTPWACLGAGGELGFCRERIQGSLKRRSGR